MTIGTPMVIFFVVTFSVTPLLYVISCLPSFRLDRESPSRRPMSSCIKVTEIAKHLKKRKTSLKKKQNPQWRVVDD